MAALSQAGLAPALQLPSAAFDGATQLPVAAPVPAPSAVHSSGVQLMATAPPVAAAASPLLARPQHSAADSDVLSDLQQAMAALDEEPEVQQKLWPRLAVDSDGDSIADVFGSVGPPVAPPAPAPAHFSLLQQVTAEIAELNVRNANLQQEIDSLSSSSAPSPPRPLQHPRQQQAVGPGVVAARAPVTTSGRKPAAGSHTLLPPTPDLSQT